MGEKTVEQPPKSLRSTIQLLSTATSRTHTKKGAPRISNPRCTSFVGHVRPERVLTSVTAHENQSTDCTVKFMLNAPAL